VLVRVRSVVGEVVKGRHIQLVLNLENAVVWAAPSLDLTDAVIERMNASPAAQGPPK
jgi:Skp family chaperone for outer membrane proteins